MGIFDKVGGGLAQLDPTTKEGQLNLLTGGLYGATDKPLQSLDDSISGQDQKDAARNAANAKEEAALAGIDLAGRQYDEGVERLNPFYQAGLGGLDSYLQLSSPEGYADFQSNYLASEPYLQKQQNVLDQLESSAAFSGTLGSGGAVKSAGEHLDKFAYDQSSDAYNQQLNRASNIVGLGQFGATGQQQASQNYVNAATQGYNTAADAQAAHSLAGASTGLNPYLQLAGTGAQIYGAAV